MTNPTPLSPAAQAVLDAVCATTEPDCSTEYLVAAALRAVADQAFPLTKSLLTPQESRARILTIAAELDGTNTSANI